MASAYEGAVVAGPLSPETFQFIRFARKAGGGRIVLLGGSQLVSGVDASDLVQGARGAEAGMYIAFEGVSDPLSQLHAAGTRFAVAFAATQPSGDVTFYAPYTAQATDVMLSAIARSD